MGSSIMRVSLASHTVRGFGPSTGCQTRVEPAGFLLKPSIPNLKPQPKTRQMQGEAPIANRS